MDLTADAIVGLAPVIPVVVLDDPDTAAPVARALVAGGLPAVEITLRTDAALECVARIAEEVPEAVVGAGTVITAAQARDAAAAGARFLVSPGTTSRLLDALQASELPFLAGATTATDVVALLERGITVAKLFPAEAIGGLALLRAFGGPFAQMRFCPTGGIDEQRAPAYLALRNVPCVGGSWMVRPSTIRFRDWDAIESRARDAAALGPVPA